MTQASAQKKEKETSSADSGVSRPFNAETARVLRLMIHSLYTNKDIFLRELISNASDACDKLRYLGLTQPELLEGEAELGIHVRLDPEKRTITVRDNGIGMNEEDLISNLGTIARSGTQEFAARLTGEQEKDSHLIGQFGVGFYASFMVAERVEVKSRKAGEEQGWLWQSDGEGEYTVSPMPEKLPRGTSITLHMGEGQDEYLDAFRLQHIIETYSDHIAFPIYLQKAGGEEETVNRAAALWTCPKSEITEQQYQEFYHHVAHQPDSPWMVLHNRVEGVIEYTNLLFIPSFKPFDLFHPDRMRRVKLYVKRVFITEEGVDLIPAWLRFLRGVVDSEDLPLNISRETLQHNAILEKIRRSLVGRVLGELKKRAEKDPQDYRAFWDNFGAVLKEGLCEAGVEHEKILEVCRFPSTHAPEEPEEENALVSMDDYIARMKEGQEEIYYLIGGDVDTARQNPQLEGFVARGVEVLLFTDHVDEFWVNVVTSYKGKKLVSITKSDVDLDRFGAAGKDPEAMDAAEKKEEKDGQEEAAVADSAAVIALFKGVLEDEVADVRPTTKLRESPVCLAAGAGGMDIRMERFLLEQKQLPQGSAKILEVNVSHPVVQALAVRHKQNAGDPAVADGIFLLLDQARINEGEPVAHPRDFTGRLNRFLGYGLRENLSGKEALE